MYDLCTYLWKGEKKCFRGNNSKGGCCANQDCLLLDFSQQGWEHLLSSLPPERIISSQSANSIHCRLRYQPDTGEKFWLLYCTSSIKTQQTNIVRARSIHRHCGWLLVCSSSAKSPWKSNSSLTPFRVWQCPAVRSPRSSEMWPCQ